MKVTINSFRIEDESDSMGKRLVMAFQTEDDRELEASIYSYRGGVQDSLEVQAEISQAIRSSVQDDDRKTVLSEVVQGLVGQHFNVTI